MSKQNTPPQSSLILRLVAGGYLVYLAWDLRHAMAENGMYILAVAGFAIAGLLLMGFALWPLIRRKNMDEPEDTED